MLSGDSVSFLHPRARDRVHAYFWSQAVVRIVGLEIGQLWESLPEVSRMLCRGMANELSSEGWVPLAWVEERKGCPDTGSNLNWGWGRKCWVWGSQRFTLASLTHRNASETGFQRFKPPETHGKSTFRNFNFQFLLKIFMAIIMAGWSFLVLFLSHFRYHDLKVLKYY